MSSDDHLLGSQPAPNTQQPRLDTFSIYKILDGAAYALQQADAALDVQLELPLPALPQLLEAIQPVLRSSAAARSLEVFVPHKISAKGRARLRQMALETRDVLQDQDENGNSPKTTLPIHTSMTLNSTDVPKALTAEQRKKLKDRSKDILARDAPLLDPYFMIHVTLESQRLPSVKGNFQVMAVDYEDGMPTKTLNNVDCLWDTGAKMTIITEDVLGADFCTFLHTDPVNEPYTSTRDTADGKVMAKVQVSCMIEMSNRKMQLDCIALVMPREAVPNQRSGVIIGQKAAIDLVQYSSVPRAVLALQGTDVGEDFWGRFNVISYVNVDNELVYT